MSSFINVLYCKFQESVSKRVYEDAEFRKVDETYYATIEKVKTYIPEKEKGLLNDLEECENERTSILQRNAFYYGIKAAFNLLFELFSR